MLIPNSHEITDVIYRGGVDIKWNGPLSKEGNVRFQIDSASFIVGGKFTVFALFYFAFGSNFQVQAPGGLIFGGAI